MSKNTPPHSAGQTPPHKPKADPRKDKLAEALRKNLLRRKVATQASKPAKAD